jgi:hypothetical protein
MMGGWLNGIWYPSVQSIDHDTYAVTTYFGAADLAPAEYADKSTGPIQVVYRKIAPVMGTGKDAGKVITEAKVEPVPEKDAVAFLASVAVAAPVEEPIEKPVGDLKEVGA